MRSFLAYSLLGVLLLAGCHSNQPDAASDSTEQNFKIYKLRGKVVSTNAATGEVTLDHEAIPGFMDAMTMPYKLKDPSILSELHPGDVITADVLVRRTPMPTFCSITSWSSRRASPTTSPPSSITCPRPATRCPISSCATRMAARFIWLSSAAKTLLITFIYTRCPLPDFCPLRDAQLCRHQPAAGRRSRRSTQRRICSASASIPSTIRRSGCAPTARNTSAATPKSAFAHWDFAVPDEAGAAGDGEVFRCGHHARRRRHHHAHALHHADRAATARWRSFIPAMSGPPDQVIADVKKAAELRS